MCLLLSQARCAAPIFHAIVALKWLEAFEHYCDDDKRAFLLGTLFPDIRYPAHIDRNLTHEKDITLDDIIKTKDPFYKGLRLHSYVDVVRTHYVIHTGILKTIASAKVDHVLLMKLLEDQILFKKYGLKYFSAIRVDLRSVNKNELRYNIPYSTIKKWHEYLTLCFEYLPSMRMQILLEHPKEFPNNYSKETLEKLIHYIPSYAENKQIISYTNKIMDHFEELFKEKNQSNISPISTWDYLQETLSEIKTFFLKLLH